MAQLIVRNLDPELVDALKKRAAQHGRSTEAEHREILRGALRARRSPSLKTRLMQMPEVGSDADFEAPRPAARRVEL